MNNNEWYILSAVCSLFALIVPSLNAFLLQRQKNIKRIFWGLFFYPVLFTVMFLLGDLVSSKLILTLSSSRHIALVILLLMSFKTFYVYLRPKNLWVRVDVHSLEQSLWIAFAMSFDWFITGMALRVFIDSSWIFNFLLFCFLLVLFFSAYFIPLSHKTTQKINGLFPYSYLISSTLFIFAMIFIFIDFVW